MKKVLLVTLVFFVSLSLFATGNQESKKTEERSLLFTTMNYGDMNSWNSMWKTMGDEFYAESGIKIIHEVVNWSQAREKITTWHLGGDAPDVIDMYWSKTFSDLGAGQFGTMPIEDKILQYIPDFYKLYAKSTLGDVEYKNHLYGVPWRIDVRPMVYRKDFLEEAGIDPDSIQTWDDLIEAGKKLTIKDANGNVTRYGLGFSGGKAQEMYSWLWQAGGVFTNDTYDKASINTPAGREALTMLSDIINKYEIAPRDFFIDPAYDSKAAFAAGNIAIIPFSESLKSFIENNAPQLKEQVIVREPIKNTTRDSFQGAGYFSATYQTKDIDGAMQWLAFISRTENMVKIGVESGNLTPHIPAQSDDFYQDNWWFSGQIKALPYGKSTQHPTAAWGAITNDKPGSPVYDMLLSVVTNELSVDKALEKCQLEMQNLMDEVK